MHPQSLERFHVLAGRIGIQVGTTRSELSAGEFREVPAGTLHDWSESVASHRD